MIKFKANMGRIERHPIQRDHSFLATQALVLFYGLSQLADLLISIPKGKILQDYEPLGIAKTPSRLPVVQTDANGTTILVKRGEGIRLKIDDEDYLIYDYRPRKHKATGKFIKGYGLVRHGGKLRKEGNRLGMNNGKSKTIRENTSRQVDEVTITHFNS